MEVLLPLLLASLCAIFYNIGYTHGYNDAEDEENIDE